LESIQKSKQKSRGAFVGEDTDKIKEF